jgi:hypothetical protein
MKKFVFEYYNEADPSERTEVRDDRMKKWNDWFASIGAQMVDGGNPFAPGSMAVEKSGVTTIENHPATGYSIINAAGMDEAVEVAKGCPVLEMKAGAVRVYEALPM